MEDIGNSRADLRNRGRQTQKSSTVRYVRNASASFARERIALELLDRLFLTLDKLVS